MEDVQRVISACDPIQMMYPSGALGLLLEVNPDYFTMVDDYEELAQRARKAQGIQDEFSRPRMTPAMQQKAAEIVPVLQTASEQAIRYLGRLNVIAHLALALLFVLGIRYRRAVGAVLLAPFVALLKLAGVGGRAAARLHDKI